MTQQQSGGTATETRKAVRKAIGPLTYAIGLMKRYLTVAPDHSGVRIGFSIGLVGCAAPGDRWSSSPGSPGLSGHSAEYRACL